MENVLKRNNFVFNWQLAYVGVYLNLLSGEDVLREMDSQYLSEIDSEVMADLYSAAEKSKDEFLKLLKEISNVSEDSFANWLYVWGIAYLNDIYNSNHTIVEKLREIANVWSMVNYLDSWIPFIHYMPVDNDESTSEGKVYGKFAVFLEGENRELKRIGILINGNIGANPGVGA